MILRITTAIALASALGACTHSLLEARGPTLAATVVKGPSISCLLPTNCPDEPFAAAFDIDQGTRRMATVRSDARGQFRVALPRGRYIITPHADAPIHVPQLQCREFELAGDSVTTVRWSYDNGTRTLMHP
jgi:hypothetical protein